MSIKLFKNFLEGNSILTPMKGKGGGGGSDASAMIAYGDKAMALQKEIFDTQRQDAQPWYQTGTNAVNQLSMLMGLNGSAPTAQSAATSREALMKQYTPQFTTQAAGKPTYYDKKTGKIVNAVDDDNDPTGEKLGVLVEGEDNPINNFQLVKDNPRFGTIGGSEAVIDSQGLNSHIDKLLAEQAAQGQAQQQNPLFGTLAKSFGMNDYQEDPGYQFRLAEGNKALERRLNAQGKYNSPEATKALMAYNQDLGSQEYGNAYNRFNINQDSLFNRLAALSGYGQTATGQIANAGSNYANAGSDILTGQGNAITAANLARANNNSSMFSSLLGAAGTIGGAGIKAGWFESDIRLKSDIQYVGEENGHEIYTFKYRKDPTKTYRGVMAQLVEETHPEAIMMVDGFKAVNYDLLGLRMELVDAT